MEKNELTYRKILTNKRSEYVKELIDIKPYKIMIPFGNPIANLFRIRLKILSREPIKDMSHNWLNKTNKKIHAKIVIGEDGYIIGSCNWSNNSIQNLHECAIVVRNDEKGKEELEKYFDSLWK